MERSGELVFIPTPRMGHLLSMVEFAKLLVQRHDRLSITVLIMKNPFDSKINGYTQSLPSSTDRIRFIDLPSVELSVGANQASAGRFLAPLMEVNKPHVEQIVSDLGANSTTTTRLAGLVLDMFCNSFIDVANQLGLPSYLFFTSGAAFLDFMFLIQQLNDEQGVDPADLTQVHLPSFVNPLPFRFFPSVARNRLWLPEFLDFARRFRETKGIVVNTFLELESGAFRALQNSNVPPVFLVGPILNLNSSENDQKSVIIEWLDEQPPASVVFLCFGSMGSFDKLQVEQIAIALERSGHRFLWSLRKPLQKGKIGGSSEFVDRVDLSEVLPEGFLDRTAEIGKVIGWAPQVDVLAHRAVGGFVSHCGWNSTLESIWFGVPVATWPLHAEQQFNAFQLVVELGLAGEIQMDYMRDFVESTTVIVSAERIESRIKELMDEVESSKIRRNVKDMSEMSKKAMVGPDGSSYTSLGRFIGTVMENIVQVWIESTTFVEILIFGGLAKTIFGGLAKTLGQTTFADNFGRFGPPLFWALSWIDS